ncbi:hypothetical protein [Streptomyces sp. NPDC059631]|uniref:hypothetical protein n=1 Tax=unclassified Streptomyces TaxID=2593676 RepID=UPI0036BB594C
MKLVNRSEVPLRILEVELQTDEDLEDTSLSATVARWFNPPPMSLLCTNLEYEASPGREFPITLQQFATQEHVFRLPSCIEHLEKLNADRRHRVMLELDALQPVYTEWFMDAGVLKCLCTRCTTRARQLSFDDLGDPNLPTRPGP